MTMEKDEQQKRTIKLADVVIGIASWSLTWAFVAVGGLLVNGMTFVNFLTIPVFYEMIMPVTLGGSVITSILYIPIQKRLKNIQS